MSKCLCCGREVTESQCSYCFLREVFALDTAGKESIRKNAEAYKNDLTSKITDICIQISEYDDSTYQFKGYENVFISDGKSCLNQFVDAGTTFQGIDDSQILATEKEITLMYKFAGVQKQVSFKMRLPKTKDDWYFGVKLNDDLTLSARTGSRDVNTTVNNIELDFHNQEKKE